MFLVGAELKRELRMGIGIDGARKAGRLNAAWRAELGEWGRSRTVAFDIV